MSAGKLQSATGAAGSDSLIRSEKLSAMVPGGGRRRGPQVSPVGFSSMKRKPGSYAVNGGFLSEFLRCATLSVRKNLRAAAADFIRSQFPLSSTVVPDRFLQDLFPPVVLQPAHAETIQRIRSQEQIRARKSSYCGSARCV